MGIKDGAEVGTIVGDDDGNAVGFAVLELASGKEEGSELGRTVGLADG